MPQLSKYSLKNYRCISVKSLQPTVNSSSNCVTVTFSFQKYVFIHNMNSKLTLQIKLGLKDSVCLNMVCSPYRNTDFPYIDTVYCYNNKAGVNSFPFTVNVVGQLSSFISKNQLTQYLFTRGISQISLLLVFDILFITSLRSVINNISNTNA